MTRVPLEASLTIGFTRIMSSLETGRVRSGEWDPILWSIGIVLAAAIVYLAYLEG